MGRKQTGMLLLQDPLTAGTSAPEPLTDAADIAGWLSVPLSWVYSKSESGELPSIKAGHYRRFRRSDIEGWLATRR